MVGAKRYVLRQAATGNLDCGCELALGNLRLQFKAILAHDAGVEYALLIAQIDPTIIHTRQFVGKGTTDGGCVVVAAHHPGNQAD